MDEDRLNIFYRVSNFEQISIKETNKFGKSRSVTDFHKIAKIGEGTYGIVYKAKEIATDTTYALKKIKMADEKDGIPISTLREINILMNIRHTNVVNLREVVVGRKLEDFFLVLDYCEVDLASVIDSMAMPFAEPQIKCIVIQLLDGVSYLHKMKIVHRDLKMSNLLLNQDGVVKIADFGMSRIYSDSIKKMTAKVVTIWYRSPEVLLGANVQTYSTDIWSCGCIMAELVLKEPLLPGKTEVHQLNLIIKLLGAPNPEIWPGIEDLPLYKKIQLPQQRFSQLRHRLPLISDSCYRLLGSIFIYDPSRRSSAQQCLESPYFYQDPTPCDPCHIPICPRITEKLSP